MVTKVTVTSSKIQLHLYNLETKEKFNHKKEVMKQNVGSTDKIIRIVLAVILAGLYFSHTVVGTAGIIALAVAVIALGTALINFCPLYSIIKLNTKK